MCGTLVIFTWSAATNYSIKHIPCLLVTSQNISYEIRVYLLHWREINAASDSQHFVYFRLWRSFQGHFSDIDYAHAIFFHKSFINSKFYLLYILICLIRFCLWFYVWWLDTLLLGERSSRIFESCIWIL